MEFISSDLGPQPRGHYSQAVVANGFVFVAGQLPLSADDNGTIPVGTQAQTRQALTNVDLILGGCRIRNSISSLA